MINLAVVNLKDILKYLVKITVIIVVVVTLTKSFSSFKTKLQKVETTKGSTFLSCLDMEIPSIKNINVKEKDSVSKTTNIKPLKEALEVELGMMKSLSNEKNETTKKGEQETKEEQNEKEKEEKLEEAKTGVTTEVVKNAVPETYTTSYNNVKIRNEAKLKLSNEMLKPDIKVNTKNIIIYHTHSCESYTPSEKYKYKATGNFRTTDKSYSVIRVGTELEKYMNNYGYNVIHDTTYYDYPSYNGSYSRSLANVKKILEKNKNTDILFDIHRDAIADSTYAPTVKIGDEYAAQLLFVIGANGSGEHENWAQNLKFAIKIQEKANEMYPGLFKPIILRNSSYNQQLGKGASIIEVGSTGNTLDQCLTSMKYLSKVLTEVVECQ